jgi:glyoxylase-like metal-dependent hydrolase (beta-lactamase superfamily II)
MRCLRCYCPGRGVTAFKKPFSPEHKALLIEGDKDLFADGSLTLLTTPGHTPGHQSLIVHLDKTGNVVLSGDVVQAAVSTTLGTTSIPSMVGGAGGQLRHTARSATRAPSHYRAKRHVPLPPAG